MNKGTHPILPFVYAGLPKDLCPDNFDTQANTAGAAPGILTGSVKVKGLVLSVSLSRPI